MNTSSFLRPIVPAAVLACAMGCITTKEAVKLHAEIDDIKANMGILKQESAQQLRDEVSSIRGSQADLLERVGRVEGRMSDVLGKLDEAQHGSKEFQKQSQEVGGMLGKRIDDLNSRVASLQGTVMTLSAALDELRQEIREQQAARKPAAEQKRPEDPFKEGLAAYKKGRYEEARDQLGKYLSGHPKGKRVPEAHYWRGDAFYRLKSYQDAISEFGEIIEKYPKSPQAADAYLKTGIAFLELGDREKAKLFLQEVVSRFPASEQALSAKKRLKPLK